MGGYRREVVHRVLIALGAKRVEGGLGREKWVRAEGAQYHEAAIAWTRGGDLLYGDEVRSLATALGLDPEDVIRRVVALGGLWRRPGPRD